MDLDGVYCADVTQWQCIQSINDAVSCLESTSVMMRLCRWTGDLATTMHELGRVHRSAGHPAMALSFFERERAVLKGLLAADRRKARVRGVYCTQPCTHLWDCTGVLV